ncbi:MAG: hypothetical protein CL610_14960 [Anaerolineaceae bacterium]|nr:hypothetical protein [Anaerolineaceae bacterium]
MIRQLLARVHDETAMTVMRRRFIRILDGAGLLVLLLVLLLDLLQGGVAEAAGLLLAMVGIGIVIQVLIWMGYIELPALVLIATLTFAALTFGQSLLLPGLLAVISAGILTGFGPYLLVSALVIGKQALNVVQMVNETGAESLLNFGGQFGILISLIIVSITTRYFLNMMVRAVNQARRNTQLMEATNEIGQFTATTLNLDKLFNQTVELVKDRFGFYHVQIFMVNGDQAELVASTGEVGQRLLANKHRLTVGSNSVIGQVTRVGRPVIASSTDAGHHHNPLLPETRTEMAVPILDGDKTIGAIDLQSTQEDAFQTEDVQALRSMADLIGAAIRNARLFESQQHSLAEQERLYRESEVNLKEIQRLNRELTRTGWSDFVRQSRRLSGITLENEQIIPDNQWTDSLLRAAQQREVVVQQANGRAGVVAVPVMLRGEVIGAIEVEPGHNAVSQDTVEMVQAVAQRLASTLDNARLYEEAQEATVQEQRVNQIVSRYQTATTVDDLLQITLTELSEALGAQRGAIRLGVLQEDDQPNGGEAQ